MLAMSALAGRDAFTRASLPPLEQLASHVDAAAFMARVIGERLDEPLRENVGRLLHDAYLAQRRANAPKPQQRNAIPRKTPRSGDGIISTRPSAS